MMRLSVYPHDHGYVVDQDYGTPCHINAPAYDQEVCFGSWPVGTSCPNSRVSGTGSGTGLRGFYAARRDLHFASGYVSADLGWFPVQYAARRGRVGLDTTGALSGQVCEEAPTVQSAHLGPESNEHGPAIWARLLCDSDPVAPSFFTKNGHVGCLRKRYVGTVDRELCVELFVRAKVGRDSFSSEFHLGRSPACLCVVNLAPPIRGVKGFTRVAREDGEATGIGRSLQQTAEPETSASTEWGFEFPVCFDPIREQASSVGRKYEQEWTVDLRKGGHGTAVSRCADQAPTDSLDS